VLEKNKKIDSYATTNNDFIRPTIPTLDIGVEGVLHGIVARPNGGVKDSSCLKFNYGGCRES